MKDENINNSLNKKSDTKEYVSEKIKDAHAAAISESSEVGRSGIVGKNEIAKFDEKLLKYISLKQAFDSRVIENDKWYNLRHEELIESLDMTEKIVTSDGKPVKRRKIAPTSARLLNVVMSKHADAMDSYPEPYFCEVEESDRETAETLSKVTPVVFERSNFYNTYDLCWWDKLKSGVSSYYETWDEEFGNIGDIRIGRVNILEIFWDIKCTDVQDSPFFFHVKLMSQEDVVNRWPFLKGKTAPSPYGIKEYYTDDNQSNADKVAVVDCYYKQSGILYFAKYCGQELIYASQNDEKCKNKNYYEHGLYPYVVDTLFPLAGTSLAFGYVDICKCPQMYIDRLNYDIMLNTDANSKPRGIVSQAAGINVEDLADMDKSFVIANGGDLSNIIAPIRSNALPGNIMQILQHREQEMNETSGNTDFSNGLAGGGVTSFSGIAALQEAANKFSRDMIKHSYESCYKTLYEMAFKLMKQFYNTPRFFRITQVNGGNQSVMFSNSKLKSQHFTPTIEYGNMNLSLGVFEREPNFDVKVKAQKQSAWSTAAINEMAKELFTSGAFAPERIDQTEIMLEMMSFDGKDKLLKMVREKATTMQTVKKLSNQLTLIQGLLAKTEAQSTKGNMTGPAMQGGEINDGIQQT